jgi:hypothetical protein
MLRDYRWENDHGSYAVHEESGVVFVIRPEDGGYQESIAGRGVGREILRLRDALADVQYRKAAQEEADRRVAAERERCARACEEYAARLDDDAVADIALRTMAVLIRQG